MPDRTEIVDHLKVIWTWAATYSIHDADCPKIAHYVDDAIRVLEAQWPRVMTLDEIRGALKTPVWRETKRRHKGLYNGWVLAYEIQRGMGITGERLGMTEPSGRVGWYRLEDYGKTWRCWTAEPTDEQREAAKWND